MNILEAFETLDNLAEAYNGAYKSPYLNLSETERAAAADKYRYTFEFTYHVSSAGKISRTRSWREGWYILDYETFHKAFDVDFARLGLLNAFDADGKLSSSSSYGNIATITDPKDKSTEAYEKLLELWVVLWSKNSGKVCGWYKQQADLQNIRSRIKTNMDLANMAKEAKAKAEEKQRQEEERIRKAKEEEDKRQADLARETSLAENNLDLLDKNLNLALDEIDPDLLQEMRNYVEDEDAVPEIRWNGGTFCTLYIPGISRSVKITNDEVKDYTPQKFKELIEQTLKKADLPNRALEDAMGLTDFKAFYTGLFGQQRYGGNATAIFVNTRTNEIYISDPRNASHIIVTDSDEAEIGPDEKAESKLVLVRASRSRTSFRDAYNYYYVSFDSQYAAHPQVRKYIPTQGTPGMFSYNEVKKFTSPEADSYFLDFETFDTWVEELSVQMTTD